MRFVRIFSAVAALVAVGALHAAAPIPRPAGALTMVEPSGKKASLAAAKGSVCVVQFLLTSCPHCQAYSKILNKLTADYGGKVKAMGVVFLKDDPGDAPGYIKVTGSTFPVGTTAQQDVLNFLGVSIMDFNKLSLPQVVLIDKKGMIRSQTDLRAQGDLRAEQTLRPLIDKLLKE